MLQRKKTLKPGLALPQDWTQSVSDLLNETYEKECESRQRHFDVFGQILPEEMVVAAGFSNLENPTESAISIFLSCDLEPSLETKKLKEIQATFVDLFGLFFDEIFSQPDWSEWEPMWQEVHYEGATFFHKITRENILLTLEADRLLREAGFSEDDEE
jgi:hypothetical protein